MKAPRCWAVLACLLLAALGCSDTPAPRASAKERAERRPTEPTHYLGERFPAGHARCSLVRVERALSELDGAQAGLVDDLHVLDATLACEDASGTKLTARDALADARVVWIDDRRHEHARSERTKLAARSSGDHLLFEVGPRDDGLLRPRVYHPASGEPLHARERRQGRLSIQIGAERLAIAPWPRVHDRAFDAFLERLTRTLAEDVPYDTLSVTPEGHAAIVSAAKLYGDALRRFSPHELSLREVVVEREGAFFTLALTKASAVEGALTFTFDLAAGAEPAVARLRDAGQVQKAIACHDVRSELASHVTQAGSAEVHCNAAGTLVPGPCDERPQLVAEALVVAERCGPLEPRRAAVPSDFRVQVMRGPALTSLAPAPRYTMTLERSGRVSFIGERWVRTPGAQEGRAPSGFVGALFGRLQQLDFFSRPGPFDGHACKASDARGDTLRVRAAGVERGVRNRDGCRGPFSADELDALWKTIEQASGVAAWLPSDTQNARDPEVWVVAAE